MNGPVLIVVKPSLLFLSVTLAVAGILIQLEGFLILSYFVLAVSTTTLFLAFSFVLQKLLTFVCDKLLNVLAFGIVVCLYAVFRFCKSK